MSEISKAEALELAGLDEPRGADAVLAQVDEVVAAAEMAVAYPTEMRKIIYRNERYKLVCMLDELFAAQAALSATESEKS